MRHAAYQFLNNYQLQLKVIHSNKTLIKKIYPNLIPPIPDDFVSATITASSLY